MRKQIESILNDRTQSAHKFAETNAAEFFIVDWAAFNDDAVQLHEALPTPNGISVQGLTLVNRQSIKVTADLFGNNALEISSGIYNPQCECVLCPTNYTDTSWVLFVETKYAKTISSANNPHNNYVTNARDQLTSTASFFRHKGILTDANPMQNRHVYGIISFPLLEPLDGLITSALDIESIKVKHNILIRVANTVRIIDEQTLSPSAVFS